MPDLAPLYPSVKILSWRPLRNEAQTLRGFFDIELASGLILRDCKLLVGPRGTPFVGMPGVQVMGPDGTPRLNPQGKRMYKNFVDFRDRETSDKFQSAVLHVLSEEHPEEFDGELL